MTTFHKKMRVLIVQPTLFGEPTFRLGQVVSTDEPSIDGSGFNDILVQPEGEECTKNFILFSPEGIERFCWVFPQYITPDMSIRDKQTSWMIRFIQRFVNAVMPPSPVYGI